MTSPPDVAPGRAGPSGGEDLEGFERAISATCAPVRVRPAAQTRFRSALRAATVGGLAVARLRTTPSQVARAGRLLTSGDPHFVKLMWQRAGASRLEQHGRRCEVAAGNLVAYETSRPYLLESRGEDWDAVVAAVPAGRFGAHLRPVSARSVVPVNAGAGTGRALALLLDELARCGTGAGATSAAGAGHLADAFISLMLALWAGLPAADGIGSPTLADRVRAHALAHLGDPGLCVESIAAALGVSVRLVHKACSQEGFTAAAWIRRQRLERIQRDLTDPALAGRGTAAIAARWGIFDATHLARQFRAAFGATPAELRRGPAAA